MKMKFFERSYILTLVLFLVFFNGAIFLLEYYTYQNNLQSEIQIAWSEQYLICESYERDHSSGGKHKSEALQNTYGKFYFEREEGGMIIIDYAFVDFMAPSREHCAPGGLVS